jgi:hypothetical protein
MAFLCVFLICVADSRRIGSHTHGDAVQRLVSYPFLLRSRPFARALGEILRRSYSSLTPNFVSGRFVAFSFSGPARRD